MQSFFLPRIQVNASNFSSDFRESAAESWRSQIGYALYGLDELALVESDVTLFLDVWRSRKSR
jgi:hypothetical protein